MTEPEGTAPASGLDDWETHWDEFADTATENPAQSYRRALIARHMRRLGPPARVLDIGCGQGDLLAEFRALWPDAELAGFELSAAGIARARTKVPDARLVQVDLLAGRDDPIELADWAEIAVCSEVLEHVEHPSRLLRDAARSVAPGGSVVITVPGGPRTAFDRHIGHRRHYEAGSLRQVILDAGLTPESVSGHGFPFFDLYKLVVLLRGDRLVIDAASSAPPSRLASVVMRVFGVLLRPGVCSSRAGWQIVAVARRPGVLPAELPRFER